MFHTPNHTYSVLYSANEVSEIMMLFTYYDVNYIPKKYLALRGCVLYNLTDCYLCFMNEQMEADWAYSCAQTLIIINLFLYALS